MNILDKIFEAGVVGCGGAGFPTHVKLKTEVEYFIVNAAECEPLLRTDRYTMRSRAEEIIETVEIIGEHLKASHKVIALKGHYHEEIACLNAAIEKRNSDVKLHELENFYPAGDEQIMVYEVTGRVIPPSAIPAAVSAVVSNVGTVAAISDALKGIPLTQKIITLTGEVANPKIVSAPVGTPIQEIIDCGNPIPGRYTVILGGPLMGRRVGAEQIADEYVTKTTSGIIVLDEASHLSNRRNTSVETMLRVGRAACIQCSFCTELCTRHMLGHPLQPHKIMRKLAYNSDIEAILEDEDVKQALQNIKINGITVYQVMGCGTQRGYVEYVRGHEVDINMLPKIKFEIVVSDEEWEKKTISAIQKAAYTGHPGDGKIFSYDLKSAMRIRTKETGYDAIQPEDDED